MKNIIKLLNFIILLSVLSIYSAFSQTNKVIFAYDNAGNRISRILDVGGTKSTAEDDFFNEETNEFINKPDKRFTDKLGELDIILYPNPTAGQVIVEIANLPDEMNCRIELYNLDGKIIIQKQNLTEYTDIDISSSPYGTYILRIISGDDVCEWKIIKK